jgi:DNA helicase-2/ATP-dependent DNA helicase PcrA
LPEVIEHVIEASGLIAHYKAEKEGLERVENLEELVNAGAAFGAEEGFARYLSDPTGSVASQAPPDSSDPLTAFLAHAALEAGEHQAGAGADALQLMTAHSAKGLEFHAVFISGLEEGLFPHENSLTEEGGLEEERRLMYVAITRARRRLYLTHAQTRLLHGQTRYNIASRFLDEIPAQLIRRVNAAVSPAAPGRAPSFAPSLSPPSMVGGFRIGQNVQHPKFGAGVIVKAEGRGADARVQVNFRNAGLKWLALEYARLSAA